MLNIIKAHINFIQVIVQELKKKKSIKEHLKFLKEMGKSYLKVNINLIKKQIASLFNKEYRKQQKEYKKYQKIKVDLQRCLKMLQYVDEKMDKAGVNRQRRRQFWRDFYSSGQVRKDIFDELMKEINQFK
jgi:hypothetical protein